MSSVKTPGSLSIKHQSPADMTEIRAAQKVLMRFNLEYFSVVYGDFTEKFPRALPLRTSYGAVEDGVAAW